MKNTLSQVGGIPMCTNPVIGEGLSESVLLAKVLLGGSPLRATEREDRRVTGFTIYWTGSSWAVTKRLDSPVRLPKAFVFKAFRSFNQDLLCQVTVQVTRPMTQEDLEAVLGVELGRITKVSQRTGKPYCSGLEYRGKRVARRNWNRDGWGECFNLQLVHLSSHLRANLERYALQAVGKAHGLHPFPTHPSQMTSRKREGNLTVLMSVGVDMFAAICTEVNGGVPMDDRLVNILRIRAGKDGWSEILGKPQYMNILVFPESASLKGKLADSDGVVYTRNCSFIEHGTYGLVRGIADVGGGRKGILKARMWHSRAQASVGPDGWRIPSHVDGWCYDSAIKWQKVDYPITGAPVMIRVVVGLSTAEDHEQKEAYKANLFYLVLGRWNKVTAGYIQTLLSRAAHRKVDALNNLRAFMYRRLEQGLAKSEETVLAESYLTKYILGHLTANDPGVISALNRWGKLFMSVGVPDSVYAGIIHKSIVSVDGGKLHTLRPGEFVPSRKMREAIVAGFHTYCKATGRWSEEVCGVRYPNTTRGSFLKLFMSEHTLDDVDGIIAVVCLEAQTGWQSDCDDHALFLPGFESLTTVESDFGSISKSSVPAEGELTPWTAVMHGRWSQERTALLVAAYMKCLGTIHDHAPDMKDAVEERLAPLQQSIQDSVQGIKKFTDLSLDVDDTYALIDAILHGIFGEIIPHSPTATIIAGKIVDDGTFSKGFANSVGKVYGAALDVAKLASAGEKGAPNLKAYALSREDAGILKEAWELVFASRQNPHLVLVDHLLAKVMGVTRNQMAEQAGVIESLDVEKLKRCIVLYGVFVERLHQTKKVVTVRSMNGFATMYADRLLGE